MRRLRTLACLAAIPLLLVACGSSPKPAAAPTTTTAAPAPTARVVPTVAPTTTTSTASGSAGPCVTSLPASEPAATSATTPAGLVAIPTADLSPPGTQGTEPTVLVPSGTPPTSLEGADLIAGTGQEVSAGDSVKVQYVGCSWTYKALFDASWSDNGAISFSLSGVIQGWSDGLVGMKVGGRRELIIPPSLGYGSSAPSPKIAPNDTLIFVVDLLGISS